jgi:hypothetical protein
MTRRVRLVALAAVAVLAFSACTSNDAKRSDVVNAMLDAGLDQEQADCIGDGIDAAFSDNQELYNEVAAVVDTNEFDDLPDNAGDEVDAVLDECVPRDDADTSDTTEGDGETTDTTDAGG